MKFKIDLQREKANARHKAYRATHPEMAPKACKKWRQKNSEYAKIYLAWYRKTHKNQIKLLARRYYQKNRERIAAYRKSRYKPRTPEQLLKHREAQRRYVQRNPQRARLIVSLWRQNQRELSSVS